MLLFIGIRPGARRRVAIATSVLFAVAAPLVLADAAAAQTTRVLNVPDTQVVDTTIRNGPYATVNQDGPVLLTRSSTIPEWERRAILGFDTSVIPDNATITSATMTLTLKSGLGTSGSTRLVRAYRIATPFVERQATWLNRQTGTPWQTPGGDLAESVADTRVTNTAGAKITFNLTAFIQRAVNGQLDSRQARVALVDLDGGGDAKISYREYHASEASTAANRPQLSITYTSGTTTPPGVIDVPAGGDLQQALNEVQRGGSVRLAAGATYVGNFYLPAKAGTDYIVLTTGGAQLPAAGVRIDPSYASGLATLRSPSSVPALRTATAASYYRIVGVSFDANLHGDGDVIALGRDAQTTLAEVPHHIELDRVLISGDPAVGQRRGISVNARDVTIMNSDIREIKDSSQEAQAIAGWNTPGPITIRNNYLSAAGENILFGGAGINIPNAVPSNILIEGNTITKDTNWRGTSWIVKNLLELKNARNVIVRGNIIEYIWQAAQQGYAIVLTPRNSNGRTPWVVVENVQFIGNTIRHGGGVFNILGHDDSDSTLQLNGLLIRDNLVYGISPGTWGGTGNFAVIGGEPRDIIIDHNTVQHTGNIVTFYFGSYITPSGSRVTAGTISGFVFTNNLIRHNAYGIFGSGQSFGNVSLNYYAPGAVVRRNGFASDANIASRYPPDNVFQPFVTFMANFLDPNARDYRLVPSSMFIDAGLDGRDLGCSFGSQ
jgi:hypothetical protein